MEFETANYFDGNIGKQSWLNKIDNQPRSYTYNYDGASRLKSAIYAGTNSENYSLSNINYDANGNILNLIRKGKNGNAFGDIDNLSYAYNGNRLQAVSDAVNGNENVSDFRDVAGSLDYTYWNDGSLKSDANRGIVLIEYDGYLQRVKQVNFNNGNGSTPQWLKFFYNGRGELLKRENAQNEVWEYSNGAIYKTIANGQPQLYQITTSEGRIVPKVDGGFESEFEYRDVWGNLRLSYKAGDGPPTNGVYSAPVITQTDDYDMLGFGLSTSQNGGNNFRFQKQERVFDYGLNWDLFKFRYSDSQIGRFHQTDPLSADFPHNSTYALQENKFGRGIELEGKELFPWANTLLSTSESIVSKGVLETSVTESVIKIGTEAGSKVSEASTPKTPRFSQQQLEKFAEGRVSESEQLSKAGLEKNSKPLDAIDPKTGQKGTTIPDALKPNGGTVEVKNVKSQSMGKQLRLQNELSKGFGVKPELIINKGAKISNPVKEAFDIKYYTPPPLSSRDATNVSNQRSESLRVNPCNNNPNCL